MNEALGDREIARQVETLADLLLATGQTLSTAESCTGGWIAQVCTDLAGSSRWFQGGVVSYSNAAKICLLQVSETDIVAGGAVSQPVAEAMVLGARAALNSDLAVAVTGIAGPGGGTHKKPVGTVWIAIGDHGQVVSQCFHFAGDRREVRRQTVSMALQLLIELLQKQE